MKNMVLLLHFCAFLLSQPALALEKSKPLPALGADLMQASVSGISSGGFMAAQLATAYSGTFMGVGIIAAGPYFCAGTYDAVSGLTNATATCMRPDGASVAADGEISLDHAKRFAEAGKIDPVKYLARQRVYVFSGANDQTVFRMVVNAVPKYYELAGVPGDRIKYHKSGQAGHAIATNNPKDLPCNESRSPYINNCDFIQSHELLRHIYPEKKSEPANAGALTGELIKFDQSEFTKGTRTSMDADAYVYIPQACTTSSCAVHVALHGCHQGASEIGDTFYTRTGYNEYADSNGIIVLYPQAHASEPIPPNPRGCWDFWGYSSEDQRKPTFHTREAPQMSAIMAMVERLGQQPAAKP